MDLLKVIGSERKWNIIKSLSKREMTATELSEQFNTSISNIIQQLAELEGAGVVKRAGTVKGARRPFLKYSIDRGFILLIEALPKEARKIFLEADENIKTHLRIWSIPQKEFHYCVESFWWSIQKSLKNIVAVAVFGSVARGNANPESDIDVLILAEKAGGLEKKFSAKIIGKEGKGKMVMAQVFTPREFENSLMMGGSFAKEVLKSMIIIYDENQFLYRLCETHGRP